MLSVKARSADVAVEYRGPTSGPAESLWLPFEFLADCEGKRDEPVHIEATGKGRCTAQWRDGSVPQLVQYRADVPADAGKFPMLPENFVENPSRLLQALVDASDTTDPDSTRFALGCIQARPDGSLGATDGRQLLVQSGFTFPWQEALLIPRSKVFGSPELPHDQPVFVGKTGDWVAVQAGAWTISTWPSTRTAGSPMSAAKFRNLPMPPPGASSRRPMPSSWPIRCRVYRATTLTTTR